MGSFPMFVGCYNNVKMIILPKQLTDPFNPNQNSLTIIHRNKQIIKLI